MKDRSDLETAWRVWKFRRRMAIAASDPPSGAEASTEELERLVAAQADYWLRREPLTQQDALQALHELNERSCRAFILSVRGKTVSLWKKRSQSLPGRAEDWRREEQRGFHTRAMLYRAFIATVLQHGAVEEASFDLALDVNDLPEDSAEFPIFGFQKQRGAHNPLLPDVDFFHHNWYRRERDALDYGEKSVSACFVGSSTGDWHTVQSIRQLDSPRLRMANHFHAHPQVVFLISKAAQCLSEEARACLVQQPYFSRYVGWQEQLRHRFLLVMDGNGATCSRLVKGLMSNCVVVKFDSPHELYYFAALAPGRDYLRVAGESDVERIVEREEAGPGTFQSVAQTGQQFAAKYLTVRSVMQYSAMLLAAFARWHRQ